MRPLQIYLDSSDFSHLSTPIERTPERLEVERFLITRQAEGRIQMRFSEAHVIEGAAITQAAIPMATARLGTIKRLCGKNCLIHPVDLVEQEIKAAAAGCRGDRANFFREDGFWFPRSFHASEFIPTLESLVVDDFAKLGRQERRQLLKGGRLTPAAYGLLREGLPQLSAELAKSFPLSARAINVIEQYYSGKVQREQAIRAVNESLADLVEFAGWYGKDWEAATGLSQHLRQIGGEFQARLLAEKEQFIALAESSMAEGLSHEEIDRIMLDAFYETISQASSRLANSIASGLGERPIEVADPWVSLPGLTVANTLAMHVARRSVVLRAARKTKASDFADTYHAIYLPYVDFFRADAFMGSAIRECKFPIGTTVVDNFLDLPAKIDAALST